MIIDEEDYLEHFGKKGMKWGVRRERRLRITKRVAEGNANKFTKAVAVAYTIPPHRLLTQHGLRGAAQLTVKNVSARRERVLKGEHTINDILVHLGTQSYSDIVDRDIRTANRKNVDRLQKKADKLEREFVKNNPKLSKSTNIKDLKKSQKLRRKDTAEMIKARQMGR
jgi:hypothetical protein